MDNDRYDVVEFSFRGVIKMYCKFSIFTIDFRGSFVTRPYSWVNMKSHVWRDQIPFVTIGQHIVVGNKTGSI